MSQSSQNETLGEHFLQLASRSVSEQIRLAQRYVQLGSRIARGQVKGQDVYDESARFVREETGRYVRNVAALSVNFAHALLELERETSERFFGQMMRDSEAVKDAPRVALTLRAAVGTDAAGTLVLENPRADSVEITFDISDFRGADGREPFHPALQIEPPRLTLGPGETAKINLRLLLSPDLFLPGLAYTATLHVQGAEELIVDLTVIADAPVAEAKPRRTRRKDAPEA